MRLRKAREGDLPALLALINGYAERGLLLGRTEASLRARLQDFIVAEVRSRAVREDLGGRGIGRALVEEVVAEAGRRGFHEVLALTRRTSFFEALGFQAARRERVLDKLMVDCQTCPMNLCCDETAMVIVPPTTADTGFTTESTEINGEVTEDEDGAAHSAARHS